MSDRKVKKSKMTDENKQESQSLSELDHYKEKIKNTAEDLVLNQFPNRIAELEKLINSENLDLNRSSLAATVVNIPIPTEENIEKIVSTECGCDGSRTKAVLFPKGVVECNQHLLELVEIMKPKTLQLVDDANAVKMGIMLMIPKIEDGNNFGVEIQEETLLGVAVAELEAQKRIDQFQSYFQERAGLVTKVAKYPHCMDFRRAVQEMDEKFRLILCLLAVELRNQYIKLHDIFTKNMSKIKEPRNAESIHMMY